jgi:hypothetical protein
MKPHVILHMALRIDGRIVPQRWPKDLAGALSKIYERVDQTQRRCMDRMADVAELACCRRLPRSAAPEESWSPCTAERRMLAARALAVIRTQMARMIDRPYVDPGTACQRSTDQERHHQFAHA